MWSLALTSAALLSATPSLAPDVHAASAVIMDAASGKVLWSRDARTPRYPASTTKIMTALLLLERTKPEDVLTAPDDVETVSGASLHLKPGETVTAREMLFGIMLRSANDGCYTVAKHISGSVEAFAALMNERARAAGAEDPRFNNPHGLNDEAHQISAYDLAVITREAMRYPAFNEVVRAQRHTIVRSTNLEDTLLINKNRWLAKDPTADGVKTGWTVPSGHTYVGSATRSGFRLITVLLNTDDWQRDHAAMLEWAFARHKVAWKRRAEAVVLQAPVVGASMEAVPAVLGEEAQVVARTGRPSHVTLQPEWYRDALRAPIRRGARLGVVRIVDADGFVQERAVYAGAEVSASLLASAGQSGAWPWVAGAGALMGAAFWVSRRNRSGAPARAVCSPLERADPLERARARRARRNAYRD